MHKQSICVIQQVEFEKPGLIEDWAIENEYIFSLVHLYNGEKLPALSSFDMLVIMGGPMGVYDTDKFPWLKTELAFIKECIDNNKVVLGICLGAQLIASALGAKVYKGPHKEIGWFPIAFKPNKFFGNQDKLIVFHWHGDTFDLPENAEHIASSEAIVNQAFHYNKKVLALQFHIEVKEESVYSMIQNCTSDLTPGKYVQSVELLKIGISQIDNNKKILFKILSNLSNRIN